MNSLLEIVQQYGSLIGILGGVVIALVTAFGLVLKIYKTNHKHQFDFLREQNRQLENQLRSAQDRVRQLESQVKEGDNSEALQLLNDQLRGRIGELEKEKEKTELSRVALQNELQSKERAWQEKSSELTNELETTHDKLNSLAKIDKKRDNALKLAMRVEGRIWERKALSGIPHFRPLHERHSAIISVLNLKGGVGKTTITANLGAAFSAKGYRALLVDLDLQGSLSSMFMPESVLTERSKEKLLLQHFLTTAAEKRKTNLPDCCFPILDGESAIIPTADSMVYAELNLTMRWLLRLGKKDNRFLLRRALHQKKITKKFDIVLLDCPPIFNTCCINALAASDYILIPVLPSRKAAERVPLLLNRLKSLCAKINPDLQIAGMVLNRTHGSQLTSWEENLWGELNVRSHDQWELPVHTFQTFIRQTTEVRDSETEFSAPLPGSELHTLFARFAAELEERLPYGVGIRKEATL